MVIDLYGHLVVISAVLRMVGTLLLFIRFAAGDTTIIRSAAMVMPPPGIPASLPWVVHRPLTWHLAGRQCQGQRDPAM